MESRKSNLQCVKPNDVRPNYLWKFFSRPSGCLGNSVGAILLVAYELPLHL